jgi:hypothetical protein
VYTDLCFQHWTLESQSVANNIDRAVRLKKTFNILDVVERGPTFYCLVGPKAMILDIEAFAKILTISFRLSNSTVDSGVEMVASCFMTTQCWMCRFHYLL